MLFIGGEDDHEALVYAGRMVGHREVILTAIRFNFNPNKETLGVFYDENDDVDGGAGHGDDDKILEAMVSIGEQKKLDDLFIDEFRLRSMTDDSIELLEKSVTSW
ncbi:hypothetical protein ACE6H2_006319 [Prunus campanulata]